MAAQHYENMKNARLFDLISIRRTRTVTADIRDLPGGISEIPIEFQLKHNTADKLSFSVPWDGVLYGFVHPKSQIMQRLGAKAQPTKLTVADWDDSFALIYETANPKDTGAFYVSGDDVIKLLEECRRPPEQR